MIKKDSLNEAAVLEQFGANAEAYVNSEVHAKGASLDRMVTLLQPEATWRVLDAATGAGHMAFALAPFAAQVTATDITPQMLVQAEQLAGQRGLGNIVFETVDAGSLPYPEGSFDLVTCRIAPHHFADIGRFIGEAARVLRPGGCLGVVDNVVPAGPTGDYINAFEKLRDPSHGRCWSLGEWLRAFDEAGLALTHQETLAKRLNFEFWAQRHDRDMRRYLRAILLEAGTAATAYLQPQGEADDLTFRLVEGIIIGHRRT